MELKSKNSLELIELKNEIRKSMNDLVSLGEKEERKLTEVETNTFNEYKSQLDEIKAEEERRAKEAEEADRLAKEQEERNKQNQSIIMENKFNIVAEIRKAMENGSNRVELRANTFGGYTTGEGEGATQHETTVKSESIKAILEPLYSNLNILNELGVTQYSGLPMGIVTVPVMSKGNAGFVSETGNSVDHTNDFDAVKLTPKRISATASVSRMLINTDTEGVQEAIKRDLFNSVAEALVKKALSGDAKSDNAPAGIFNGATYTTVKTYGNLTDFESDLEDKGIDNAKFLLSPKASATFKAMAKSAKSTQLVLEGDLIDGISYKKSAFVPSKKFAYGDMGSIVVGLWD